MNTFYTRFTPEFMTCGLYILERSVFEYKNWGETMAPS
jgi:hypothetical protein